MKKFILISIGVIVLGYLALRAWASYYTEKYRPLSYEQAGTNFTKAFNSERVKRGLPIIPKNWSNINPLYYKVQTWVNPDTIPPRYAEKTVVAGLKAQIEGEEDRYELNQKEKVSYQLVIEYNYLDSSLVCTLRETWKPDSNKVRYSGDILYTLTIDQAIDTLRAYGLTRLGINQ